MSNESETPISSVVRKRLFSLTYGMLGSWADAEDLVQETLARLLAHADKPEDSAAWCFRVATNLALDKLRHEKLVRKHYHGPWLPEPFPTGELSEDAADVAERNELLSLGVLRMLETLSANERGVYVLREAFGLSYPEIGALLRVTSAAARQRMSRARRSMEAQRLRDPVRAPEGSAPSDAEHARLYQELIASIYAGDEQRVAALFADDAELVTDGGGVVSAAIRPVLEPQRIARVLVHLAGTDRNQEPMAFEIVDANGAPAVRIARAGALDAVASIEHAEGMITGIYVVRNPEKLKAWDASMQARRVP